MLHGIEKITYDGLGYIYWKGQPIEHYDNPTSPDMAGPTKELERRCLILERRGSKINTYTAIWNWDEKGNGDRWEIAFDSCEASKQAQSAAKRICLAYGIGQGVCDPAYIASVIQTEMDK